MLFTRDRVLVVTEFRLRGNRVSTTLNNREVEILLPLAEVLFLMKF